MKWLTVTPAYGRDYESADAAFADWKAGKDFIIRDISSPWDGKPINAEDAEGAFGSIKIRFDRLAEIVVARPGPDGWTIYEGDDA